MRLLLDTHVLLWALTTPTKLPARIAAEIVDPRNAVFVSPVSTWEVAIKTSLGKLDASVRHVLSAIARTGFEELPVRFAHTLAVSKLPRKHNDPFDRLLIAQALDESLTIVTADRAFRGYPVQLLWE
jgi:PIN domain nuclease of toxin-antitoxin system